MFHERRRRKASSSLSNDTEPVSVFVYTCCACRKCRRTMWCVCVCVRACVRAWVDCYWLLLVCRFSNRSLHQKNLSKHCQILSVGRLRHLEVDPQRSQQPHPQQLGRTLWVLQAQNHPVSPRQIAVVREEGATANQPNRHLGLLMLLQQVSQDLKWWLFAKQLLISNTLL